MDKLFLGRGLTKYLTPGQPGQLTRSTDSTSVVERGRGLRHWSEIFLEGVPPIGSLTDSSRSTKEPPAEAGAASKIGSPVKTSMTGKWDKMPPREEEEVIAELDAAIDKAGDEEEEEPKPLDEADITEAAHHIKDDPMLHLALGLTEPYWASMALAISVQKLHEYQAYKNHQKQSQVLSYGKLATRYEVNKDQLQEISVIGKLQQKSKKRKAGQDDRVVVLKQQPGSEDHPTTSSQGTP